MSGKGIGSAYLWNLKRNLEKFKERDYLEQAILVKYESEVCEHCPRGMCEEVEDLELCYKTFTERSK